MSVRKRPLRASGEPVAVHEALLRQWPLPRPGDDADKEDRGRLLVIGGSREIAGAVLLAGTAALRAGAGKVAIATARSMAAAIVAALPEARFFALEETGAGGLVLDDAALGRRYDAMLIGPGMQDERATRRLVARTLDKAGATPLVLDAAAMEIVCDARRGTHAGVLVTPHAGELAGLSGLAKAAILRDPAGAALRYAREWGVTVALKGATTIVAAPDGRSWRHEGGNIGLAVSGSGDALAGIVAGLAARGAGLEQAAVWGVALHALAGARLAERHGALGFLAREIAGEIPGLMHELSETKR